LKLKAFQPPPSLTRLSLMLRQEVNIFKNTPDYAQEKRRSLSGERLLGQFVA
jgi:hypothetical protein